MGGDLFFVYKQALLQNVYCRGISEAEEFDRSEAHEISERGRHVR